MQNKDFYIPYIIEDERSLRTLQIKKEDVIDYCFGDKHVKVYLVPNENPQVFCDVVHLIWRDLANVANETRCKISDGKGGFITCRGDCKTCPKMRADRPDSLEAEFENNGYEVQDLSPDQIEIAELRMLLEDLFKKLRALSPIHADIIEDMYQGCSQEEIALKRGKSTGTIGEHVPVALALAKAILEGK